MKGTQSMELVLASQSPRRRELLTLLGHPFRVQVASVDETMEDLPIEQAIARLSYRKAAAIGADADQIVIGADTVVVLDGKVLGKPADAEDAVRMLQSLSGKTHQVMTGVCALKGERALTHTEVTEVTFRPLTDREIRDYVATKEPMDKAGAYGIQGGAARFVEGIRGDYYTVMGLPVCRLGLMLEKLMEETQ